MGHGPWAHGPMGAGPAIVIVCRVCYWTIVVWCFCFPIVVVAASSIDPQHSEKLARMTFSSFSTFRNADSYVMSMYVQSVHRHNSRMIGRIIRPATPGNNRAIIGGGQDDGIFPVLTKNLEMGGLARHFDCFKPPPNRAPAFYLLH